MSQADLSKLNHIKAFVFDVDGVFTDGSLLITESGEHLRTMNIRDGYAVKRAVDAGYHLFIISGGKSEGVSIRFHKLGVREIHLGIEDKSSVFLNLLAQYHLKKEDCLYMGDDLPDLEVMQQAGIKVCPADAEWEIAEIADFMTARHGGKGAVREIIQKVMQIQGRW